VKRVSASTLRCRDERLDIEQMASMLRSGSSRSDWARAGDFSRGAKLWRFGVKVVITACTNPMTLADVTATEPLRSGTAL